MRHWEQGTMRNFSYLCAMTSSKHINRGAKILSWILLLFMMLTSCPTKQWLQYYLHGGTAFATTTQQQKTSKKKQVLKLSDISCQQIAKAESSITLRHNVLQDFFPIALLTFFCFAFLCPALRRGTTFVFLKQPIACCDQLYLQHRQLLI